MRRWVVGTTCSITIILVSLASMIQFSNGWTIGDYIFKFLNQPPWSNGSSGGIHYSAIDSLFLLLIGAICLRFSLESAPEKLAKRISILVLILVLCWPLITNVGRQLVMNISTGIDAIEYDRRVSSCNFKDDNGIMQVSSEIHLTNHGNKPVTFSIEIKPPSTNNDLKRFFGDGLVLRNKDNTIETFELNPKEAHTFMIESYANNTSGLHMSGGIGTPILVLFNEQGERTFAR